MSYLWKTGAAYFQPLRTVFEVALAKDCIFFTRAKLGPFRVSKLFVLSTFEAIRIPCSRNTSSRFSRKWSRSSNCSASLISAPFSSPIIDDIMKTGSSTKSWSKVLWLFFWNENWSFEISSGYFDHIRTNPGLRILWFLKNSFLR